MRLVFWLSAAFILYVYAGYPALMAIAARRAALRRRAVPPPVFPPVSIVVAARNEAARIGARVENLLALEYPAPREIIVVSDGSTDETAASLKRFGASVRVIELPAGGKATALNVGVERAANPIIVFADARQRFAPNALLELIRPFSDPQVGAATGELVLDCEVPDRRLTVDRRAASGLTLVSHERRSSEDRRGLDSTIADGLGLYWRYEKSIRRDESASWSTLGATGAIYAMRRSLWQPLPPETILDDVLAPMRVVLAGYRVVFAERALAFDRTADDANAEARRKVRTLAGNYQILALEPRLLLPWRNPVWTEYMSHKLARLIVPYALIAMFAASIGLFGRSLIYAGALVAQCAFYLLAGYGGWLDWRGSLERQAPPQTALSWPPVPRQEQRGVVNG
jgi:cellulose synthase/poly-beta-1,6-N-acetylglucosamine synthase-like glycosyltransferase